MASSYQHEFNPNDFMTNFNQNFSGDEFFEMVRRVSEREAEARREQKKAKKDAVSKLPVIKIEKKHCKKIKDKLEPPMCTVCCDAITMGTKGMFMPCGHVYHPDCLTPWLEKNNTCPVCRFELPTEKAASKT
jgi:E3 ubiquitin-protein ligase RNF115/126